MTPYPRQPLKHLAGVSVSNVDKKSVEGDHPVRLVNYTDVYYGDRIGPALPLMDATATTQQLEAFRLRPGDVAITKDSETAEDIGIAAFIEDSAPNVVLGYHLALLRPRPSAIDPRFLYWCMRSDLARGQLSSGATGVTRFGLRQDVIASVALPTPVVSTQRAIADFLDAETTRIDALITKKRRLIDLLEGRFASYLRARLEQVGPVLPLKRRWTVVDCKHRTPEYVDGGYPVVSPGDVTPGRLDLARAHRFVGETDYNDLADAARRPRRGDIVYSRNASIGIASYVDTDAPFCMGQDVCLVTSLDQDQLYLTYVLNSVGVDQLDMQKIGSTFSRVNVAQIVELNVPTPEPAVQRRLATEFDTTRAHHDATAAKLREQIDLLREHRQALITAAVTGEMGVPGVAA